MGSNPTASANHNHRLHISGSLAELPRAFRELQTVFGFRPFTMSHYRQAVHTLTELAMQTDT